MWEVMTRLFSLRERNLNIRNRFSVEISLTQTV